jgi:four helix bundle protein
MPSQADELQARVRHFAIRILKFVQSLPHDPATETIARQLARAAHGASDNYRSARRARSRAEFIARLGVAVDEADETESGLNTIVEAGLASGAELNWLVQESAELRAIFVASLRTARANVAKAKSSNPEILKC